MDDYVTQEVTVVRLDEDQYLALERQLPAPCVTAASTEAQIAASLGQQQILRMLRDGYTTKR